MFRYFLFLFLVLLHGGVNLFMLIGCVAGTETTRSHILLVIVTVLSCAAFVYLLLHLYFLL